VNHLNLNVKFKIIHLAEFIAYQLMIYSFLFLDSFSVADELTTSAWRVQLLTPNPIQELFKMKGIIWPVTKVKYF